jgi:uncharacterized protein (TIGR02646 family)
MICVERGPEPDGFVLRAADWRKRFEETHQQNPDLTPAQFWSRVRKEVRADAQVLYEAFYEKCAYCEAKMSHVSSPQIEHYRPQNKFPDRMFDWSNWLVSCGRCNQKKWAHFPDCDGQPCLLDPTAEDPSGHLDFSRTRALAKTHRGAKTVELIGLNRSPLEDDRARWMMTVNALLLLWRRATEVSAQARELLIWAMQVDAPYAAMTRCYLRELAPRFANPETPHAIITLHNPQEQIASLVEQFKSQFEELA